MSDDAQVLSQLSAYLQTLPTRAPDQVLRGALATVGATPQRRSRMPTGALRVGDWRMSRAAVLTFAALGSLVVLVVLAQVFSRLPSNLPPASMPVVVTASPSSSPSFQSASPQPSGTSQPDKRRSVTAFEKPFSYLAPKDVPVFTGLEDPKLVYLLSAIPNGSATPPPPIHLYDSGFNYIVVGSTANATFDTCPRRGTTGIPISRGDDVVLRLENEGGMSFDTAPFGIGGMAGFAATVTAECLDHLHIDGAGAHPGDASGYDVGFGLQLTKELTKFYFVPVGDTTVVVQASAASEAEATRWFPIAERLIESIEFTDAITTPLPQVAAVAASFARPFSYDLPDGPRVSLPWLSSKVVTMISPLLVAPVENWTPGNAIYPDSSNGIVLASTADSTIDTCPRSIGSVSIRSFDDFAFRLQDQGGFSFDSTPTTIGGRDAVRLSAITVSCLDHLHVGASPIGGAGLALAKPFSELYLVPFDDTTVVIQVWSQSQAEFDAWQPIADEIVQSLHFFDLPSQ